MHTTKKRSLNLFDTIMLVSGSMIGSGIFIVSADMTRVLGSPYWVMACWLLSGIITLFAALSYGELAGMLPEEGGQFFYLKRAYGKLTAFVYGWTVFSVIQTGVIAAVAVAFAKFIAVFFPFFSPENYLFTVGGFKLSTAQLLAVSSILVLTYINSLGINNAKIIQRLFTSTKLIALFGLIVVGIIVGSKLNYFSSNLELPFNPKAIKGYTDYQFNYNDLLGVLGVALIGALFSSDAWNNVTFIAAEIKEPQRNIPLGLFFGVLIVTVLYLLANIAYFMLLPALGSENADTIIGKGVSFASSDRVGSAALGSVFGSIGEYLMAALIVISTFGCNNGLILSGARLFESMANSNLFFSKAKQLNKNQVPANALWIQAIWASALCLSGSYGDLLNYSTFASLIFYIITISTLFYFRKHEPNLPRPYKAFGYPLIPFLYILITSAICINLIVFEYKTTLCGLLIMALGIPIYFLFNKKSA